MFRIIKTDGAELGITDSVNYIKLGASGSFSSATEEDAIGIAFNSEPYNLVGHNDIKDVDTVVVSEIDGGQLVKEMASYAELAAAIREGVNSVD